MAYILSKIYQNYVEIVDANKVAAIDHYFLLGSPLKIIILSIAYWHFVKNIGPRFMEKRQPYDVKHIMLVYNVLQVIANLYLAYAATIELSAPSYNDWSCMRSNGALSTKRVVYYYFLLKVVDYMDTIFMVLRKNFRQISFLHVYHHILMVFGSYYAARFVGGGHASALGYINCFVHAIMYFYYFLSALRPELKQSLWWKKHITHIQMLQFLTLIVHFARALLHKDCEESRGLHIFSCLQNVVMLLLFSDFYIKTYVRKSKSQPKQQAKNA